MTAEPGGRAAADQATSDPAPLLGTTTAAVGPADDVTAGEIAEFLHLARFRSPVLGGDPVDRAALMARKADLFTRIADQHARTTAGPPSTTAPTTPTPTPPEGRTS